MQDKTILNNILDYKHPPLTVDTVLFTIIKEDLKVLLIERLDPPFENMWSLPGGFVEMQQSLEEAALSKLKEKTNVDSVYLEQLYTFGALDRDPRARVITIAYYALVSSKNFTLKPSSSIGKVEWHSIYELPTLAFDHQYIIGMALERLRNKLGYTTVGFQLLPEKFTLPELCRVYEVILNRQIDKRNFRKKIAFLNILDDTGETTQKNSKKPAKLYCFKHKEMMGLSTETSVFDPKIPRSLKGKDS